MLFWLIKLLLLVLQTLTPYTISFKVAKNWKEENILDFLFSFKTTNLVFNIDRIYGCRGEELAGFEDNRPYNDKII